MLRASRTLTWHGQNKPFMDMNLALSHLHTLLCLIGHAAEIVYFKYLLLCKTFLPDLSL